MFKDITALIKVAIVAQFILFGNKAFSFWVEVEGGGVEEFFLHWYL